MSAEDDKMKAPVLTTVNEDAVRTWAKRYEGYLKRGGKRRARECVDDDVLDAVALFGVEVKAGGDGAAEQREDEPSEPSTPLRTRTPREQSSRPWSCPPSSRRTRSASSCSSSRRR